MLADRHLGCPKTSKPLNVIMDFGGPNVAKPLHVGHIRSPLIGDCLQRVYRFYGDEVLSDVHLGDWGTQMGMLIEEIRKIEDLRRRSRKLHSPRRRSSVVRACAKFYDFRTIRFGFHPSSFSPCSRIDNTIPSTRGVLEDKLRE